MQERTFTGDICADDPPAAQSDLGRLSLSRVGLLGLRDADFETDALHLGSANHSWAEGAALLLRFAASIADLVKCRGAGAGGRECSKGAIGDGPSVFMGGDREARCRLNLPYREEKGAEST